MSNDGKIILAAINSRYIQSNTAVYYLYEVLKSKGYECEVVSNSVNDDFHNILNSLLSSDPSVICFSCYIWNIETVIGLCKAIRKIKGDIRIILGGPEVSYDAEQAGKTTGADLIVRGEGETAIVDAVESVHNGQMAITDFYITGNLDEIPSPYTPYMMQREKDKLIYFESSRGCPFNCIYCLSSATKGVRYFSLGRVMDDIGRILEYRPDVIKFTDRSFNSNKERAVRILEYIKGLDTKTCFHLEIYPAVLEPELAGILIQMPPGRVQLEAGIQSTDENVLARAKRPQDSQKALENLRILTKAGNIHIHADLLAGLPGQDLETFRNSFNETILVMPHVLQVGFLKILKGTGAAQLAGYEYLDTPPYEVLSSDAMSYIEIDQIRRIARMVDMFYNSGQFQRFMKSMLGKGIEPFRFFLDIYSRMDSKGYTGKGVSRNNKYNVLAGLYPEGVEDLAFDYLSSFKTGRIPDFLGRRILKNEKAFEILGNEGRNFRDCTVAEFRFKGSLATYIFDYSYRDSVSGLYGSYLINPDKNK